MSWHYKVSLNNPDALENQSVLMYEGYKPVENIIITLSQRWVDWNEVNQLSDITHFSPLIDLNLRGTQNQLLFTITHD